ncbi:MAG: sigma-70 family RNA polymerase sigma factor [Proteobacteria bacterium]|nr:sigma-70 family RNA polymerase sigma factor [Pseudomonadota bacterium]
MGKKEEFFERLFKARYHSIYSFFLKRLGSSEDAQDACQETFMRMVRHNGTISLNSPDSYLFRVARNLATDMLRTRAIRSKYKEAADIEAQPSTAPLSDANLDTQKRRELIKDAISELPPRCREVFVLHQLKDLTYEETAKRLNISPNTVKNHYVKALLRLRTVLAKIAPSLIFFILH